MAISGVSAAANAFWRTGSAALTSGHHDSPVAGRLEATKVMKKGGAEYSAGLPRALADAGSLKLEMIGMMVLCLKCLGKEVSAGRECDVAVRVEDG